MKIKLRNHQQQALEKIINTIKAGNGLARGRIVIPTGGGKTFVEAAALQYQIQSNQVNKIHLVVAPRILLLHQLIDEYRLFADNNFNIVAFHSGNYEPDAESLALLGKVRNTMSKSEIHAAKQDAVFRNRPLVVFSTYHSMSKLESIEFDTLLADESQFCVAEGYHRVIKNIDARVKLFFTATEKHTPSDLGRGLNNEKVFGERLHFTPPSELIDSGIILPPRLHFVYGKRCRTESDTTLHQVIEIAKAQSELTREMGFSKILFAMNKTAGVKVIEDNMDKIRKLFPDHTVFTITSKTKAKINGVLVQRYNANGFMDQVKTCKSALIFHNDILSEGIDVDGITGVALMRSMEKAKLLQTIGRAVRIYKEAPELKKCAWISVPVIDGNDDDAVYVQKIVEAVRSSGYDIDGEDISMQQVDYAEAYAGKIDPDVTEDAYGELIGSRAQELLDKVVHDLEHSKYWEKVIAASTTAERLKLIAKKVSAGA